MAVIYGDQNPANPNDTLTGTAADDTLYGLTGNDTLDGGAGVDTLRGGYGNDTYILRSNTYQVNGTPYYLPADTVEEDQDSGIDTVRSYGSYSLGSSYNVENLVLMEMPAFDEWGYPTYSYGAGNALNNVITGNSLDNMLAGYEGNDTLYGGGGKDHLNGGIGNDRLYGGSGNDTLIGDEGDDILNGGEGGDEMRGGMGNDTYYVDALPSYDYMNPSQGDMIIEYSGEGIDTVISNFSFSLMENLENLTLTEAAVSDNPWMPVYAMGNSANNVIRGNSQANDLLGYGGDDTLYGNGGQDHLVGDIGNDRLYGGSENDVLDGGDGNDILDGGTGYDMLRGGTGNDTYIVDSTNTDPNAMYPSYYVDEVVEDSADGGIDTVRSSAIYGYALGANLENLVLVDTPMPAPDFYGNVPRQMGFGNELNNVITGNSWDNDLGGMAGDDILYGNAGKDNVWGDTGNDRLYGGSGADQLNGGDGNDILDGGTGIDQMQGGMGNDTYYVDGTLNTSLPYTWYDIDMVTESAGEGVDTVRSAIGYTLTANVENLVLVEGAVAAPGYAGGEPQTRGYGNELNNVITGNSINNDLMGWDGDDTLNGLAGKDMLQGGEGNDRLYGGADKDYLYGDGGSDILDGGTGVDFLFGGTGNDIYYVDATETGSPYNPFTADVVTEYANEGTDTVVAKVSFGLGDNVENLTLLEGAVSMDAFNPVTQALGNGLNNVLIGNSGDNDLFGYEGNDSLRAGAGNDFLVGGAGNDALLGGAGDDFYALMRGDGADTLFETSGNDVVGFAPDIAYDQLWFSKSGNNLVAQVIGTGDRITFANWYATPTVAGNDNHVETLRAGNFVLADTSVQQLVNAMAAFAPPPAGQLTLDSTRQAALADVLASSWAPA